MSEDGSYNSEDDELLDEAIRQSLRPDDGPSDGEEDLQSAIQHFLTPRDPTVSDSNLTLTSEDLIDDSSDVEDYALFADIQPSTIEHERQSGATESDLHPALQPASGENVYTYESLDRAGDFRVMRLSAVLTMDGHIQFDLITACLDSKDLPKYTALSYAWGRTYTNSSHLTDVVMCHGQRLQVTATLNQALHRICETHRRSGSRSPMLLWVDSICINQVDLEERRRQVQQMADIYARCSRMVVWLGEHSEGAVDWFDRLSRITKAPTSIDRLRWNMRMNPSLDLTNQHLSLRNDTGMSVDEMKTELIDLIRTGCIEIPSGKVLHASLVNLLIEIGAARKIGTARSPDSKTYTHTAVEVRLWSSTIMSRDEEIRIFVKREVATDSYKELLQRPWFKRKWVIQEIAQTNDVQRLFLIADKVIPFAELVTGIRSHALLDSASPLGAELNNETLLSNLARYRNTLSSDPHDQIYALAGISSDSSWMTIDYTVGADQLYIRVAEHYIQQGNVIAVLALATVKQSTCRLPSWVPDWRESSGDDRSSLHTDALNTLAMRGQKLFQPSSSHIVSHIKMHSRNKQQLDLKGWIIPSCIASEHVDSDRCLKCELMDHDPDLDRQSSTSQATSNSKGKAPIRDSAISARESLLSMRHTKAYNKWSAKVRQQFEEVIHLTEVLFLLEHSPFGFVLLPCDNDEPDSNLQPFLLEYCFQVDEEGWPSNWFASILGNECQEWISTV